MNKKEIIKILILKTIGNFLLLFAIFGFFATFGPAFYYEANYRIEKWQGVQYTVAQNETTVQPSELGKIIEKEKEDNASKSTKDQESLLGEVRTNEKIITPKSTEFALVIPKLGINEEVFANTSPINPDSFLPVLQRGVAHAQGSAFPGMNGTTYIFAHSTDNFWNVGRYNAVFYLLKEMEIGDEIVVFFRDKRYNYVVSEKKITDADDTSYLKSDVGKGEILVLQTCWPPGTTWKRLFVFAKPKI